MPRYSEEFKDKIVQKMVPPNSQSVAQIGRETGVCGHLVGKTLSERGNRRACRSINPENWNGEDKLAVVIETAALNEQGSLSTAARKGSILSSCVLERDSN